MLIGIDASSLLKKPTGIGQYTYNLIKALDKVSQQQDVEEFSEHHYKLLFYSAKNRPLRIFSNRTNFSTHHKYIPGKALLLAWQYLNYPRVEDLIGAIQLFHSPNNNIPPVKNCQLVTTIHDLFFLKEPEETHRFGGRYFYKVLPKKINLADRIIAVSEATRKQILELFNDLNPDKVKVIYEGLPFDIEKKAQENKENIKKPDKEEFILFVGTLEPRKNLLNLIETYKILHEKFKIPHKLVLCGAKGWLYKEIFEKINRYNLSEYILWEGYLSRSDLIDRYEKAAMLVLPSKYEGFGLPILEAMALGTPVIASNVGAIPEVAGSAALLINPEDEQELAEAILQVIEDKDYNDKLIMAGKQQVLKFNWCESAKKILNLYQEVIRNSNE